MTPNPHPVSDMLLTVKSREVQRGMLAEMRNDPSNAAPHYMAAAYLELVLAEDYRAADLPALARRSRLSAGSCLWRVGKAVEAREVLTALAADDPEAAEEVRLLLASFQGPQCDHEGV